MQLQGFFFFFPDVNSMRTSATEANSDFIPHLQDTYFITVWWKTGAEDSIIERRVICES